MIRAESDPARIVVGLSVLGALWLLFTLLQRSEPASGLSHDGLAIFAASMAMSATLLLALLCLLSWRVSADQRALDIGIALGLYGCLSLGGGALLPRLLDGDIASRLSSAFILAGLPALVQFGSAAGQPQIDSGRGWRETVTPVAIATTACGVVAFAICVLVPGFAGPARGLYNTQALAWAVLAMVHAMVAYRTNSHLLHWTAVVATGTGLGLMVSSSEGTVAATGSGVLVATAMGIGLFGVAVTVYRCHADQQRRTLAALVEATLATARAQSVTNTHSEHRHEAHAALLGIEAAAQGISRHRDLLTEEQFASLSEAMVAEVHRLHELVGGASHPIAAPDATFDLLDVLMPVVSCHRASGLEVQLEIPSGTTIRGSRDATAQVVAGLLANARRHAPGSPVTLLVDADDPNAVVLRVEDRGPGVPEGELERIFDRGVSTHPDGSGLGLFVARRMMQRQGGSISVARRSGGGSSFNLRFDRDRDLLIAGGSP